MKRAAISAVLIAGLGCVVVVKDDGTRPSPRPTPRPAPTWEPTPAPTPVPPPPVVQVNWTDCRLVVLREYFECDWDLVGTFDFYETRHGIDEEDLFVLLFISRRSGLNFHEVVFHYERSGHDLLAAARACRLTGHEVFVDVASGSECPAEFEAAYRLWWRRERTLVLTNVEFRALLWLRISVHYFGWSAADAFVRWESAAMRRVRAVEAFREDYDRCGRGGRSWREAATVEVERPWIRVEVRVTLERQRTEAVRRCEDHVQVRARTGQAVVVVPSAAEARRRAEEAHRRADEERRRAAEEAARRRVAREVTWVETRTVVVREYYECDWDVVGQIEYYESRYGLDEQDLLVLVHIARHAAVTLHDVVARFHAVGRSLLACARAFRMTGWEFFVEVPRGTRCPSAYEASYASYWKRDRSLTLTNVQLHALVWLRISVNYCGWTPAETFERWTRCEQRGVAYREVVREEHARCGAGGRTFAAREIRTVERPWAKAEVRTAVEARRTEAVRRADQEVEERRRGGKEVAPAPGAEETKRREEESRRRAEAEQAEARRRAMEAEIERHKKEQAERDRRAQEEAARRDALEARRRAEAEEQKRKADEARRKSEEERKAEEERNRKAEAEEKARKAEEEKRRRAEEEAARRKAEEERKTDREKKAEEERRKKEEAERRKKEEAEKDRKEKEEAEKKDKEEAERRREESDRKQKEEAERRKKEEDERRKKEERRSPSPSPTPAPSKSPDPEAKKAEEERRKAEEAKKAEEERRKKEAEKPAPPKREPFPAPKTDEERVAATSRLVKELDAAIREYHKARGRFPKDLRDIARCLREERDPKTPGNPFYVFENWMLDGAGQAVDGHAVAFRYRNNADAVRKDREAKNKDSFDLWSCGANRRDDKGGGDDAGNFGK